MATRNEKLEQYYKDNPRKQTVSLPLEAPMSAKALPPLSNPENDKATMKFSIIFPTRDRVELLDKLLSSLVSNTFNYEDVEVLIAVDNDDRKSFDFICRTSLPFVSVHQVPRSLNFSRDYYSFLASKSTGQWIITINDDCVFETKDWDVKAYEALRDKPRTVYGWIEDGIDGFRAPGHGDYCCFPLQGRAGYEALGYIFPSRIPTWGADIWAKNLYDQIDSVVEVPITIRHYCHHNKTREQDEISKRIAMNQVPFDMRPNYEEVNKLLATMRKEMSKV